MKTSINNRKNKKIKVIIVPNHIDEATREEMWSIYQSYYNYTKEEFLTKMGKNNYYSFYINNGKIVGFTGLRINQILVKGKKVFLMYFGQTVIEKAYRGKSLIPLTGFKLCVKFARQILTSRSFWWADTLTYKAYLVFAKTLDTCYPSRKQETPSDVKAVIDQIGQIYYEDTYMPERGTVRKNTKFVADPTAEISQKVLVDPDIAFYTKANPNYAKGDGLITLGEINFRHFKILLGRTIKNIFRLPKKDSRRELGLRSLRPQI